MLTSKAEIRPLASQLKRPVVEAVEFNELVIICDPGDQLFTLSERLNSVRLLSYSSRRKNNLCICRVRTRASLLKKLELYLLRPDSPLVTVLIIMV